MILFLVGVFIGVAIAYVVLRSGLLPAFGTASPARAIPAEVLADAARRDPGLAAVVASEPQAPVDSVPPEVTLEMLQALHAAKDQRSATAAARRFIKDADVAELIAALESWSPRFSNSEQQFENSFLTHVAKLGLRGQLTEKERIVWGGGGGSRVAVPDLTFRQRVLVELKGALGPSGDSDRALGQMLRYLLAWKDRGPAILVICGEVSFEIEFLIRLYVDNWRNTLRLPVTVYFKQYDLVVSEHAAQMPV